MTFSVYMIGSSKSSAAPTIMFFCQQKEPRREAMHAMKRSGILEAYPGFKVGHMAVEPGNDKLVQHATNRGLMFRYLPGDSGDTMLSNVHPILMVFYDNSEPIKTLGMPAFVKHEDGSVRRATANALFDGTKMTLMSVCHMFQTLGTQTARAAEEYDSDYSMMSDTTSQFSDEDNIDNTSRSVSSLAEEVLNQRTEQIRHLSGPSSPPEGPQLSERDPTGPTTLETSPSMGSIAQSSRPVYGLQPLGFLLKYSVNKDWALIAVTNERVKASLEELAYWEKDTNRTHIANAPNCQRSKVFVETFRGHIGGTLYGTPLYTRVPKGDTF